MSFDALSKISRAVTLFPRAWLGSDTLNMPDMNSVILLARSRSRKAKSRSLRAIRAWNSVPAALAIVRISASVTSPAAVRLRLKNLAAR